MSPSLQIPLRNLWRNRRRTLLACSAVFFGVVALLFIRGTLNGVQNALRDALVQQHTGALQVHRAGYLKQVIGTPLSLHFRADGELQARVLAVANVTAVSPRLMLGALLSVGDLSVATLVTGLDPLHEYDVCPHKRLEVSTGRPIEPDAPGGVVVAAALARRLAWNPGDTAVLVGYDDDGVLNAAEVTQQGTLGLPSVVGLETKVMFMPLAAAQQLVRLPGEATELVVAVDDLRRLADTKKALQAALGAEFEVHSWEDLAPAVIDDQANQEIIFGILVFIFLLAALTGITNTMLVNMLERTREIGTMLAVGARRSRIVGLFVMEGVLLALLGCALGCVVGAGAIGWSHAVGFHMRGVGGGILDIYPTLDVPNALLLAGECAAGAVLASLYPAWKASRMAPTQALAGLA